MTENFIHCEIISNEKLNEVIQDMLVTKCNLVLIGMPSSGKTTLSEIISKEFIIPHIKIAEIADAKMYEDKTRHYQKKGVNRRGQKEAHTALCELYTKILKINITDDSYQIVNMDLSEQTKEKGFSDRISEWLYNFGVSGQVHPDDLEEYLKLTNIDYIRKYFNGDKTSLHIFYRRNYSGVYKQVMMEMIPAKDYSEDDQSLYLYVKDIDR